ncbi:MAG: S41 family peptidase [Nitrospinota bacterium]|nr:MAG: S41 family peptidase [Nitrospinota bacterium]
MGRWFTQKKTWGAAFLVVILFFVVGAGVATRALARGEEYETLKIFTEVLSLVQSNYVEEVDTKQLIYGAIQGMLRTLDPHTSFMPPDVYKEMQMETEGEFGGIGVEVTFKDDQLTVVSPIEDTPAFRAGLKAGDQILKIDGEPTKNMSLMEAVKRMRGPRGTQVILTIMREGFQAPQDFVLARDIIKIKSVKYRLLPGNIGYVKIRSFHKNTAEELDEALFDLEEQQMTGLILDLRNNPGGLLNQAVEVADRFLAKEQLIVFTRGRMANQNMEFKSHEEGSHLSLPMVVLVNAGSASASEIVAGALQDLGRAVILGVPTFGKGSVQTIIPLSDGSGLRLTTARYYTPKGRLIQGKGIIPDIIVEETAPPKTDKPSSPRHVLREKDLENSLDREKDGENAEPLPQQDEELASDYQLQRAVDLLKGWEIFRKTLPLAKAG